MSNLKSPAGRRDYGLIHNYFTMLWILLCAGLWVTPWLDALELSDDGFLGEAVGKVEIQKIPIQVISEQPEIAGLLQRAFSIHGLFRLADDQDVQYVIRMDLIDEKSVSLSVRSGSPLKSQIVSGNDWRESVLRAADLAVFQITGLPGFFAGQIVYVGNRTGSMEIYQSDLFFGRIRQLTNDRAKCITPRLSPDGLSLLYTSYFKNGFPDIYKIDLRTMRRTLFMGKQGTNNGAIYHPSGSSVAMTLSATGNAEIFLSDAQGRIRRRLTKNNSIEASPDWSPDGSRLVFTSDSLGKPQIYVMDVASAQMQRVPTNISGNCSEPAWNPKYPNLLAFTCVAGPEFEVAIYDFVSKQSTIITRGEGDAVEPCWLRDGRHLIYTERHANTRQLVIIDSESREKHPLSDVKSGNVSQAFFSYPITF